MSRVAGLFLAVSTMAALTAACGGGADGDARDNDAGNRQQDDRPRAKSGLIHVSPEPLDLTAKIEPTEESIHAPYLTATVTKLGTVEKIDTKSGPKYPARGEKFYAIEFTTEVDKFDLSLSRKFPEQVQAGLSPIHVRTESDDHRINLADRDRVPKDVGEFGDTYSIVAAGPKSSPPALRIGEPESPVVQYDLATGRLDGEGTKDLDLSENHRVVEPVDAGIYGEVEVDHSITFVHARLTPTTALASPAEGNNLLIVTAKRGFTLGEPESPGQFSDPKLVYYPQTSVRVLDSKGKASMQHIDPDPYRDEPQEEIPDSKGEDVLFAVEVPRNQTEFVLEYQPELAFSHSQSRKFELDSTKIKLEFAPE